ncbi:ion channel [Tateyamaria sp. ANG-S1]|uniref:ion channel n=1 Tax=Tateyamaria sp. ANG-S1 TaxID=1577905 RepID=UPI00068E37CC|nr:ion channel [Tateyamaria sp. ANG-S1]
MTALQQILLGIGLLAFSAVVHVGLIAVSIPSFAKLSSYLPHDKTPRLRNVALLLLAIFVLVLAHTIQVWSWAVSFLLMADLPDLATSFCFTTVTYTTLGYGDIVLGAEGAFW